MEEKELIMEILNKLNDIQKKYNPTNCEFILKEKHNVDEKQICASIVRYNNIGEVIVVNALVYYKEYNDKIYQTVYSELNSTLFNKLLFTNTFKNIISNIDLLK